MKLKNCTLVLEKTLQKDGALQFNEVITSFLKDEDAIDCKGYYIAPGFIDIHTHGMNGYDFMDATNVAIEEIAHHHLLNGATTIYPTSLAGTLKDTTHFLDVFQSFQSSRDDIADMPGVHLEGPYFAESQKGAQPIEYLRNPDPKEYMFLLDTYGDCIKRWSSASELTGTKEFAKAVKEKGILLSYAHSDANYNEAMVANTWGFTHFTHFYSCMSCVHRKNGKRYGGLVEAGYLLKDTTIELISDGMHLPKELVNLAYQIKGSDHTCLITDSMRAANMPEGEYILGSVESNHKVIVKDGVAWMPTFDSFAGSVSTAMDIVRITATTCDIPLYDVIKMITKTPAKIMGLNDRGVIEYGKKADFVIFDSQFTIKAIIKNGKMVVNHLEV